MILALLTLQSYPARGGVSILSHRCNSSESGVNQLCYITNIPDSWAPPCKNSSRAAGIGPRANSPVSPPPTPTPEGSCLRRHSVIPALCPLFVGHHLHPPGPPGAGRAWRTSVSELRPLSLSSQASHNSLAPPLILPLAAV